MRKVTKIFTTSISLNTLTQLHVDCRHPRDTFLKKSENQASESTKQRNSSLFRLFDRKQTL